MKKYIPLLSALVLALLLTACGALVAEDPTPSSMETPEETPLSAPTETPEPTETTAGSFSVYTDWSRLEPYEPKTAVYTRRYENFTDTLIPADDYGPLLPFAGAVTTGMEYYHEDYPPYYYDFNLYGLVTLEGEVVVDPVFTRAFRLTRDMMLLGQVFHDEEGEPVERYALCAGDGSWCTDFLYWYDWEEYRSVSLDWGIPLLTADDKLVVHDLGTGKVLRALDLKTLTSWEDFYTYFLLVDPATGYLHVALNHDYQDQRGRWQTLREHWLVDPQGKAIRMPEGILWVDGCREGLVAATICLDDTAPPPQEFRDGYVDEITGEWAIEPVFISAQPFTNGVALVDDGQQIYFINTDGEAITGDLGVMPKNYSGYWYVDSVEVSGKLSAVFDEKGRPVPDSPLLEVRYVQYLDHGWVYGWSQEGYILTRGREVYRLPGDLGHLADAQGDRVLFEGSKVDQDNRVITLTDLEGNIIARWDSYSNGYFIQDIVTGENYIRMYTYRQPNEGYYDMNGNCLDDSGKYVTIEGGVVCHYNNDYTLITDLEGNVVFCWPIHTADD